MTYPLEKKSENEGGSWKLTGQVPNMETPRIFAFFFVFSLLLLVVATGRFLEQFALRGFRGWHALGDLQVP